MKVKLEKLNTEGLEIEGLEIEGNVGEYVQACSKVNTQAVANLRDVVNILSLASNNARKETTEWKRILNE